MRSSRQPEAGSRQAAPAPPPCPPPPHPPTPHPHPTPPPPTRTHLVEVEDEVQLAHVAKVLVQHLHKLVHHLQRQQLVVVCRGGGPAGGSGSGAGQAQGVEVASTVKSLQRQQLVVVCRAAAAATAGAGQGQGVVVCGAVGGRWALAAEGRGAGEGRMLAQHWLSKAWCSAHRHRTRHNRSAGSSVGRPLSTLPACPRLLPAPPPPPCTCAHPGQCRQ